jgi:hypothetical protein
MNHIRVQLQIIGTLILYLGITMAALAAQDTTEFSADLIQTIPQQGTQTGKIFVGKDQVRTEFDFNGRTMIQIIDMKNQQAIMLDPENKTYILSKAMPQDALPGDTGTAADTNPCAGMPGITCKKLGTEDINGRPAQKWEFENTAQAESGKMITWLDEERKIPLRQTMPDGSSMEMQLVGREMLNGRPTEKWEMTAIRPGGQSQVSYQWYDPFIKMNIREEQTGGFVREFQNVRIGKQPASLFTIPAGYKEVSMPQGQGPVPDQ